MTQDEARLLAREINNSLPLRGSNVALSIYTAKEGYTATLCSKDGQIILTFCSREEYNEAALERGWSLLSAREV